MDKEKIRELWEEGKNDWEISKQVGIPVEKVSRFVNKLILERLDVELAAISHDGRSLKDIFEEKLEEFQQDYPDEEIEIRGVGKCFLGPYDVLDGDKTTSTMKIMDPADLGSERIEKFEPLKDEVNTYYIDTELAKKSFETFGTDKLVLILTAWQRSYRHIIGVLEYTDEMARVLEQTH